MSKTRYLLFPVMVVATVLLQLALPVVARADDGTPPTDQPTEVATDTGTGTTDVATPVPVVEPVATDVPLLAQVPEGTDVVVLNADGSVEPLATQAAADIIASSDPIWCPGIYGTGGETLPGGVGCTDSYDNFTDLIADGSISGDGTIYIENGTYAGSETSIVLDGSVLTGWGAISLQGGWDFVTTNSVIGTSDFFIPIVVSNWTGGAVTLADLTVSDTDSTGITVTSPNDVTLTNVSSTGNANDGALVDTTSGEGNVEIDGGSFSDNQGTGLVVNTNGGIYIGEVQAIQTLYAPAPCTGTDVDNGFTITYTDGFGDQYSSDAILDDETLGVALTADVQAAIQDVSSSSDTVSGPDGGPWQVTFHAHGLQLPLTAERSCMPEGGGVESTIWTAASLDRLGTTSALHNGGDGASLYTTLNDLYAIDVNSGLFSANTGWGLVATASGDILLGGLSDYSEVLAGILPSQLSAYDGFLSLADNPALLDPSAGNGQGGAYLYSQDGSVGVAQGLFANSTNGSGLWVNAPGDIILFAAMAAGNSSTGITLDNGWGSGDVDLTEVIVTENRGSAGLQVYSAGEISSDVLVAFDNYGNGIYLDNTSGDGGITLTTGAIVAGNGWTGLDARSNGDINVENVQAMGIPIDGTTVQENGAYLDTSTGAGSISVSNSQFILNLDSGLTARTATGDITLDNVLAVGNGQLVPITASAGPTLLGVVPFTPIYNDDAYGAGLTSTDGGAILVTGSLIYDGSAPVGSESAFDGNGGKGLWIESTGPVQLTDIEASGNGAKGAYIGYLAPCGAASGGIDVTISGGFYQNNPAFGVYAVVGPDGTFTLAVDGDAAMPAGGSNGDGTTLYDFYADSSVQACPPPVADDGRTFQIVNVPQDGGAGIPLDCDTYLGTVLVLPDGDRATLVCTVSGTAALVSQKNDSLPGALPGGNGFVSGMNVTLTKDGVPVNVITEGGYLTVAFPIPADQKNAHFAILYWDPTGGNGAGAWVELPPYEARPDGSPMLHALHPGLTPDDLMRIQGGVRTVGDFVKVSVNFPGIFVLVTK